MIERLLPTIDAVEGPNEPDDGGFVYDGVPYPHGAINGVGKDALGDRHRAIATSATCRSWRCQKGARKTSSG